MEIYIKPVKKIQVTQKQAIYIRDICEVVADKGLSERVKNIKLMEIKEDNEKSYLISIIDIISKINLSLPGNTVNNVGEIDTIVEYSKKNKSNNKLWLITKVCFVTLLLFAGSATAIMSFHSDAQMSTVFENYYYIFFKEHAKNPIIIDLPYSIGLAVGIIVFFNHFSGKKITNDPTPIEVEMSNYESEVTDNIIDTLNTERLSNDNS